MKLQMRSVKSFLFIIVFSCLFAGCGDKSSSLKKTDEKDYYHNYQKKGGEVALVIDTGSLRDNGYNQAAYEGTQTYALAAGVSYSYYYASANTQKAYENAVLTAIKNNARLVICASPHFEQAVGSLQDTYSDVYFLLLDGVPRDASGNTLAIAPNVHCITYHEEEAGYLAGYMAVLEGYKKLGFIGGEQLPSVERYGYGYLQGIDDAASLLDISGDVHVDYWYANVSSPNQQIEETSLKWYQTGTEIIFACGGSLYQSVLSSAQTCNGKLIGADVDQHGISELFLTSAMKGIKSSVIVALDDFYASGNTWPEEMAGTNISYGAGQKCIELPLSADAWRFKNVSTENYLQILADLKAGKIQISDKIDAVLETEVSITYHNK